MAEENNGAGPSPRSPLTIIMTPDKRPFFAATYIPKAARYGRAGMMDLIPQVREAWQSKRSESWPPEVQKRRVRVRSERASSCSERVEAKTSHSGSRRSRRRRRTHSMHVGLSPGCISRR